MDVSGGERKSHDRRADDDNILGKLGLASRTQAALYAVEHKLVEPKA
jgi:hypothetical protein